MRHLLAIFKTLCIAAYISLPLLVVSYADAAHPCQAFIDQQQKEMVPINEGEGYLEGTFNDYSGHLETKYKIRINKLVIYKLPEIPETMVKEKAKAQKMMIEQMRKRGMLSEDLPKQMETAAKQANKTKLPQQYKIKGNAAVELILRQTSDEISVLTCNNPYSVAATVSGYFYPRRPESAKESSGLLNEAADQIGVLPKTIDRIINKTDYNVALFLEFAGSRSGQDVVVSIQRRMFGEVYVQGQSSKSNTSAKPLNGEKIYSSAKKAYMSLDELIKSGMFYGKLDNANKTITLLTDTEFKLTSNIPGMAVNHRMKGEGVVQLQKPFKDLKVPAKKKPEADKPPAKKEDDQLADEKDAEEKQKSKQKEKIESEKEKSDDISLEEIKSEEQAEKSVDKDLLDWISDITEDSWDYWVNATKDIFGKIGYNTTAWHFEERDAKNVDLQSYEVIDGKIGWRLVKHELAEYHQNGYGKPELKYVCADGREVIYDGDTHEIVNNPRYKGTYNYVNMAPLPEGWHDITGALWFGVAFVGHGIVDVLPYKLGGNIRGEH